MSRTFVTRPAFVTFGLTLMLAHPPCCSRSRASRVPLPHLIVVHLMHYL